MVIKKNNSNNKPSRVHFELEIVIQELTSTPPPPELSSVIDREQDQKFWQFLEDKRKGLYHAGIEDGRKGIPALNAKAYPVPLDAYIQKGQAKVQEFQALCKTRRLPLENVLKTLHEQINLPDDQRAVIVRRMVKAGCRKALAQVEEEEAASNKAKLELELKNARDAYEKHWDDLTWIRENRYNSEDPERQLYDKTITYVAFMVVVVGVDVPVIREALLAAVRTLSNVEANVYSLFFSLIIIFCAHKTGAALKIKGNWTRDDYFNILTPFSVGMALVLSSFVMRFMLPGASFFLGLLGIVLYGLSIYVGYLRHRNKRFFLVKNEMNVAKQRKDEANLKLTKIEGKFRRRREEINSRTLERIEEFVQLKEAHDLAMYAQYKARLEELKQYEEEVLTKIDATYRAGGRSYMEANIEGRKRGNQDTDVEQFDRPLPDLF